MNLRSIRMKILGLIAAIMLIVLSVNLGIYITDFGRHTEHMIRRQAETASVPLLEQIETLGQSLGDDTKQNHALWAELSEQCRQFYEEARAYGITHVAVVDDEGTILAHNDPSLQHTPVKKEIIRQNLGWRKTVIFQDEGVYHTLFAILDDEGAYLGCLDIGVSAALISETGRELFIKMGGLSAALLLGSCGLAALGLMLIVKKPLRYLVTIGDRLSQGYLIHTLRLAEGSDEIAALGSVFVRISDYLRDVLEITEYVATGKLGHTVQRRSKRDTLSRALQDMLTYLQTVADLAARIADGDLSGEIALRSDVDAFGRAMRTMTTGLQSLIRQIQASAEQLAALGGDIAALAEQDMHIVQDGENSVNKLVTTMKEVGASVENVAANMDVLSASVEQTSASVQEMTTSIANIAANAAELEQQTQTTIAALQHTSQTMAGITEKAEDSRQLSEGTIQDALEGQEAVAQVTASMDTIQQTNAHAVDTITHFTRQTEDIGTILDVITEITDQSSLLALNASIIAAQAGSHGRGFAVIADEMRNLATTVNASTKNIATIVKTVQHETQLLVESIHKGAADIAQGVNRTREAGDKLDQIIASARRSSTVVAEIVEALQQMRQTTAQEMQTAMEGVYTMTASITKATKEQKASTLQINEAIEHIRDLAAQTQSAASQQLAGVQQILDVANVVRTLTERNLHSSEEIEQTAGALDTQAQTLLQAVDRFKLRPGSALVEQEIKPPQEFAPLSNE